MAKFYGSAQGQRGECHRLGHSAIDTVAASWDGSIRVRLWEQDGATWAEIEAAPWRGHGHRATIYRGPLADAGKGGGPVAP